MNTHVRSMWIMNFENVIEKIVNAGKADGVELFIQRYGHSKLCDISDSYFTELFGELNFVEYYL